MSDSRLFTQPSDKEWEDKYKKLAQDYDQLHATEFAGGDSEEALTKQKLLKETQLKSTKKEGTTSEEVVSSRPSLGKASG
jgi:hypothetical protein